MRYLIRKVFKIEIKDMVGEVGVDFFSDRDNSYSCLFFKDNALYNFFDFSRFYIEKSSKGLMFKVDGKHFNEEDLKELWCEIDSKFDTPIYLELLPVNF